MTVKQVTVFSLNAPAPKLCPCQGKMPERFIIVIPTTHSHSILCWWARKHRLLFPCVICKPLIHPRNLPQKKIPLGWHMPTSRFLKSIHFRRPQKRWVAISVGNKLPLAMERYSPEAGRLCRWPSDRNSIWLYYLTLPPNRHVILDNALLLSAPIWINSTPGNELQRNQRD